MPTAILTYDDAPKSSNRNTGVGGRGNPHGIAREKGRWEGIFQVLLMKERVPRPLRHVKATAELQFRDKRRRDADNFYFPISKPLGDALVKGGWLEDDNPDYYAFERVRIHPERLEDPPPLVKAKLVIVLEYEL